MVDGVNTLPGQPAAKNVVVEHRKELVLAPNRNRRVVERSALDQLRIHENATLSHVQVCVMLLMLLLSSTQRHRF